MATQFYALQDGSIQGFGDGAQPPEGAVLLDGPPAHGLDRYDHESGQIVPYAQAMPLYDRLQAVVDELPDEALAVYAPLLGAVGPLLATSRVNAVKLLIQNVQLADPSHESIKDALLAEFED